MYQYCSKNTGISSVFHKNPYSERKKYILSELTYNDANFYILIAMEA